MKVFQISLQVLSKEEDETGVTTAGEQNALGSHLGYWDYQFNYEFNDESSSSKCTINSPFRGRQESPGIRSQ